MSDDEDRESRAFREAMRDVRRLTRGVKAERAAPKPPPKARFTRADHVEVLRESLLPPADEAVLATGDELSFRRPHISEAVLTRLRRGAYVVDSPVLKNVVNHWLQRADNVLAFGSARAVDGGSGSIYVLLRSK